MSLKLTVKGLDKVINALNVAPDMIEFEIVEALRKSTTIVKQKARRKAGSPPIVNKGELARSIHSRVKGFRGFVNAEAKHAAPIEFGTRPHMPPVAALERWAQLKLGKSGIGFAIAKKIARVGTKAQPYMEPAIENSLSTIRKFFDTAGNNIIKRI